MRCFKWVATLLLLQGPIGVLAEDRANEDSSKRFRVVSTTLGTDEILMGLQCDTIALSTFVDDPMVSNVAMHAQRVRPRVVGRAEPILSLRPDVVFVGPFLDPSTLRLLERADVPVVLTRDPSSLEAVRENIREIGARVGKHGEALTLIAEMDAKLASIKKRVEGAPKPRVLFYTVAGSTVGTGTIIDELIDIGGGKNLAREFGLRAHAPLSMEQIIRMDPELILLVEYRADSRARSLTSPASLELDPAWKSVRAIRNHRVYRLPAKHLLSTSHHVVAGAEDIASALHPERFRVR